MMNNNIPGLVVDSIVRQEGTEEIVGIATVTLPDIENVTEEISGMGVDKFNEVLGSEFNPLTFGMKFMGLTSNVGFSRGKTGGELGRGNKNEPELEFSLTYYKLELEDTVLYEIDKFNKKAIVDGEDLYAPTSSILG